MMIALRTHGPKSLLKSGQVLNDVQLGGAVYPTGWENVQSWQSCWSWRFEWAEQQRCLLPGQRASQTSSPEQQSEPGSDQALETGQKTKRVLPS